MQSGPPPAGDLTPRQKILLADYTEVCRSHDAITDFRAKLLALLPLASGAGIGLLVARGSSHISRTDAGLLLALGLFGAIVTAGLFPTSCARSISASSSVITPPGSSKSSGSRQDSSVAAASA
jgi:hypothetical protein